MYSVVFTNSLSFIFRKQNPQTSITMYNSCKSMYNELEWPSGLQRHACGMDGHRFEPRTSINGCHADLYTVSRCRTRGESQEFIARRWQSTQARDPPWLWNPGETSPEVQNRGISGPTKRTYVLQKFKKKQTMYNVMLKSVPYTRELLHQHMELVPILDITTPMFVK